MRPRSSFTVKTMRRYRSGANEALNLAERDGADLRDVYLAIAQRWNELADRIEREIEANRLKTTKRVQ